MMQKYVTRKKRMMKKKSAFNRLAKEPGVHADTPVNTISQSLCRIFLTQQFESRSGYAANKDRKNLSTAWDWGRDNLDNWPSGKNPFRSIPKFPEIRHERYVPTEADFWKVYDIAKGQDKVLLKTFLHLAARRSEVFKIKIRDLDFKNQQVRLRTRKRTGGHLEEDWVPMTDELRSDLKGWLQHRLSMPVVDKEHVFICLDKTAFCYEYFGKPFKNRQHFMIRLCEKAGVKPFGFHAIRHLTASILYQNGEPVAVIQDILRHKSPNTTERYLKKLFGTKRARKALEGSIGSGMYCATITQKRL